MKVFRRILKRAWALSFVAMAVGQTPVTRSLPSGPGPLDNPLKGFAAYSGRDFQHSGPVSMAFTEVSWRELEPEEGRFAFDEWERSEWETPLAKGKPIVLRVWMDYPRHKAGVPQWLIDKGVKMTPYTDFGGGLSPDYENPDLQSGMLKLIAAMGARYDRNTRVASIQLGLLGHWGEWHTYPVEKLFASDATQKLVVDAFRKAFPHKQLMARNPSYRSCRLPSMGFHDDMIPEDTLGPDGWMFLPAMRAAGVQSNWKVASTGGEMVPGAAKRYLGKDWAMLLKAVEDAHFTWIGPYCPALERAPDATFKQRMNSLIRKLGYEYRLTKITAPASVASGRKLSLRMNGVNQGVAPFYYPWKVQLALIDSGGKKVQQWTATTDIRKWLPGAFVVNSATVVEVPTGTYRLGIGILDPYKGVPNVSFANTLPKTGGFTILTTVKVVNKGLTR